MKYIAATALLTLATLLSSCAPRESSFGREWYIRAADDADLYVREIGRTDGRTDPIVVLHGGFGAEHSYLLPALEELRKHHTFILFDQRGSLRSPADAKGIALENFVSDLDQIRTELNLERLTLLAHSGGSILAYAYLEKHPERVENLVLVGPAFPFAPGSAPDRALLSALDLPVDDTAYVAGLQKRYRDNAARIEGAAAERIKQEGLEGQLATGRERTYKWQIRYAAYNIHNLSRWREVAGGQNAFFAIPVFENLVSNAGGWDAWLNKWAGFYPALQSFKGRLTFIVGEWDYIDPGAQFWPLIGERLPLARVEIIKDAGHNVWIDQPELFNRHAREALR